MTRTDFRSVPQRFRSLPKPMHSLGFRTLLAGFLFGASVLSLEGCGDRRGCFDSYDCGCHGRYECILGCHQDSCDLVCSHTSSSCGAVCEDDCRFQCHDTNHCSTVCDDDCRSLCHHTYSCVAECGAGCSYECHDTTNCAVRVGPNSEVTCRSLEHCDVACDGPCHVTCTNVSRCDVRCATGLTRRSHARGWSCE